MIRELSINDLAVYENVMLYKNHCSDYTVEENLYRKLIFRKFSPIHTFVKIFEVFK